MIKEHTNINDLVGQAQRIKAEASNAIAQIRNAMSQLPANSSAQASLKEAMAHITGVSAELSGAMSSPGRLRHLNLSAMESMVQSANTGSGNSSEVTETSVADVMSSAMDLRNSIASIGKDLFENDIFRKFRHFKSKQDEDDFNRNKEQRRQDIDHYQSLHTDQGDLRAGSLTVAQVLDEGAHGADASSDYRAKFDEINRNFSRKLAFVKAAGGSTKDADEDVSNAVHNFYKAKGLSDAQINAKIAAAGGNALDAVKLDIGNDRASEILSQAIHEETYEALRDNRNVLLGKRNDDIGAALKASGVVIAGINSGREKSEDILQSLDKKRSALKAAGSSTAELDAQVTQVVRTYYKSKGKSDKEIDAKLANAKDNPLDALKLNISKDQLAQTMLTADGKYTFEDLYSSAMAQALKDATSPMLALANKGSENPTPTSDKAMGAKLKSLGVEIASNDGGTVAHGVTIQKPAGITGQNIVS